MCVFCLLNFEANSIENFTTREFKVLGSKWGDSLPGASSGGLVTYSFADQNTPNQFVDFDSFIIEPDFQSEINQSMASWENVADIRFLLSPDAATVDIRFGWGDIDGKGGVLGQTTIPSGASLSNVVVVLDSNEDWFLFGDSPENQIDFSATVIHEVGHAIGIDHSESEQALMHASYSQTLLTIQQDDINAATAIYGPNEIVRIDVHRFFNPSVGGHLFTADAAEANIVGGLSNFQSEGVGFAAISRSDEEVNGSLPVYRFYNPGLGSHFFTASELEKEHVLTLENYLFEGVGFRAFDIDTSATTPVHRFFNPNTGGHFFTASDDEKTVVMDNNQFRYEGETFFAFVDLLA
jgi:hypothetical protein